MQTINIIGAGKLGTTLAYLWANSQQYQIAGILNRSYASSLAAREFIQQGQVCHSLMTLPPADITMIACPDDQIQAVAKKLYEHVELQPGHLIFHCSGALHAAILKHPQYQDIDVGSVHPVLSFHEPKTAIHQFPGSLCGIEAEPEAQKKLSHLFQAIKAILFPIAPEYKTRYHIGCVFASNYVIALAHHAQQCFQLANLTPDISQQCTQQLMHHSLQQLNTVTTPLQALTGPIKRGDVLTIAQHLQTLSHQEQRQLYQIIGASLIQHTSHSETLKQQLTALLVC